MNLLDRFWFDRFDARGPHIFALFSIPENSSKEVRRQIGARVENYLREQPSFTILSPQELELRHTECRGKALTNWDRQPSLAENNTWALFEHDPHGYPFYLTRGLGNEQTIWELEDELVQWVLLQLSECGQSAALTAARWVAELDCSLPSKHEGEAYWRYHATTLLTPLAERLTQEEEEVLSAVPSWIGERNYAVFSLIWNSFQETKLDSLTRRLADMTTQIPDGVTGRRWSVLREIVHCTLKQLGLGVALHIPIVLFAWNHNLADFD